MADKRISQLVDRGTVANNDVVPIVVSGATTTNKATISSIQTFMQGNLDLGVTSVGITLGSSGTDVSVSGSPITSSGNITINLPTASATNRGLLSAADWVTFNSKQPAGNYVTTDTTQTITGEKTFSNTALILESQGTSQPTYLRNSSTQQTNTVGRNSFGFNNSNNIFFNKGSLTNAGILVFNNTAARAYTLPDASGTLAFTSDLTGYVTLDTTQTITAQKTFTTSGSSDTMIISHGSGSGFALDVLKAGNGEAIRVTKTSGSGNAMTISGGNFEAGTIVKTGGTSSQFLKADGSVDSNAYTTNTGTVTSVGLSSATSGVTIGSTPITTSGTITLAIATASGSQNGLLSSTDWTTFNNKQNALTNPVTGTGAAGQVAYWTGTNSQTGSNNLFWDNTNIKLGIGTNTPEATGLTVAGGGILVSLDSGAARKVLELYASSTGAKISSTYVGASSYGSLELLTSNSPRLTITAGGDATFSGALNGTSASFTGGVTSNATTSVSFYSGTYVSNTLGDGSFATYSGRIRENLSYGLNIDLYDRTAATWRTPLSFNNTGGAATFSSTLACSGAFIQPNQTDFIASTGASNRAYAIGLGNTAAGDFVIMQGSSATGGTYTTRLAISPTGNVGIGTASPSALLHLEKASQDNVLAVVGQSEYEGALFLSGAGSGKDANIVVGNNRSLIFYSTANSTPAARGTKFLTIDTQGIKFGTDTAAANALDDYEEGTFTPGLTFGGGSTGMTFFDRAGVYTKIGRQVTCTIYLALTAKGSSTGQAVLTGLPFTNANYNRGSTSAGSIRFDNITYSGIVQIIVGASSTTISFEQVSEAGTDSQITNSNFNDSTEMSITVTYFV